MKSQKRSTLGPICWFLSEQEFLENPLSPLFLISRFLLWSRVFEKTNEQNSRKADYIQLVTYKHLVTDKWTHRPKDAQKSMNP